MSLLQKAMEKAKANKKVTSSNPLVAPAPSTPVQSNRPNPALQQQQQQYKPSLAKAPLFSSGYAAEEKEEDEDDEEEEEEETVRQQPQSVPLFQQRSEPVYVAPTKVPPSRPPMVAAAPPVVVPPVVVPPKQPLFKPEPTLAEEVEKMVIKRTVQKGSPRSRTPEDKKRKKRTNRRSKSPHPQSSPARAIIVETAVPRDGVCSKRRLIVGLLIFLLSYLLLDKFLQSHQLVVPKQIQLQLGPSTTFEMLQESVEDKEELNDFERNLHAQVPNFKDDLPVAQLWKAYEDGRQRNTHLMLAAGLGMGVLVGWVFM